MELRGRLREESCQVFVKFGFQRDYGAVKVDVGQDEVDLARILTEQGIPVDELLRATEAFNVLRLSTEMLYLRELAHIVPSEAKKAAEDYSKIHAQFLSEVTKIKVRLGLEQHAAV